MPNNSHYDIISKPGCAHCEKAITLLKAVGADFSVYNFQEVDMINMFKLDGFKTFPQIWQDDEHIGGYEQLALKFADIF